MAYQTRRRDPLFDSTTQAALERRGGRTSGPGAAGRGPRGGADAGQLPSRRPELAGRHGRAGAEPAGPARRLAGLAPDRDRGLGAWGIALVLMAWGLRLTLHSGSRRLRAAGLRADRGGAVVGLCRDPCAGGGLAAFLRPWRPVRRHGAGRDPGPAAAAAGPGLRVAALGLAVTALVVTLYVLGATMAELRALGAFCLRGSRVALATILGLTVRGAAGTLDGAAAARQHLVEKAARQRGQAAPRPPLLARLRLPAPRGRVRRSPPRRRPSPRRRGSSRRWRGAPSRRSRPRTCCPSRNW